MMPIFILALKDMRIRLRYRWVWVNMAFTPLFILGPYVLSAKMAKEEIAQSVLVGSLLWYWLNQYFWGVGDAFGDERQEGTLVSIALSPVSLLGFLVSKAIDTFFMNVYISICAIITFALVGIRLHISLWLTLIFVLSGIFITMFALFFSAAALIWRKLSSVNYTLQLGLGILSGMTSPVRNFPFYVRMFSYAIPLTYLIVAGRAVLRGNLPLALEVTAICAVVSVVYLGVGMAMLKKAEEIIRREGGWESW